MATFENGDRQLASRSVFKDFTSDALTILPAGYFKMGHYEH